VKEEFKGLEHFIRQKEIYLERVIVKEGCWGWKGTLNRRGYARFKCGKKQTFAHIFSWRLFVGDIPFKHFVCHECDNPICTNPAHLFVGLPKYNSRDMVSKSRQARGSNAKATLSEKEVRVIKKRLETGETSYAISKDFPVNMSTIYSIQYGLTWKHV